MNRLRNLIDKLGQKSGEKPEKIKVPKMSQHERDVIDELGAAQAHKDAEREKALYTMLSPMELAFMRAGRSAIQSVIYREQLEKAEEYAKTIEDDDLSKITEMLKEKREATERDATVSIALGIGILKAKTVCSARLSKMAGAYTPPGTNNDELAREFMLHDKGCDCAGCKMQYQAFDLAMKDIEAATETPYDQGWKKTFDTKEPSNE